MKPSTGYVKKNDRGWTARITFTDPNTARRVNRTKTWPTKSDADDWLASQRRSIRRAPSGGAMTFDDLLAYYVENYAKEAEWKNGRVVAGMRSWKDAKRRAEILAEYLGPRRLASLTHDDLKRVRESLFKREGEGPREGTLSIATVNRIMSVGRRMFHIAERKRWVERSPFADDDPLVTTGDESERDRILTPTEEKRLLAACEKKVQHGNGSWRKRSAHLRPIIITAIDTGMRLGEILKLRWQDVDLKAGVLRIPAGHTKTLTARVVGVTPRLRRELSKITRGKRDDRVFGITRNVQSSWRAVRRDAGLQDVRFHDLRHTFITRAIEAGIPLDHAGKLAGHKGTAMTSRYNNPDAEMARKAARVIGKGKR